MEVGASDAKAHLSALLDRVQRGERITITRHGMAVAMLVPVTSEPRLTREQAIEELRKFRKGRTLGGISIRELIQEGRM